MGLSFGWPMSWKMALYTIHFASPALLTNQSSNRNGRPRAIYILFRIEQVGGIFIAGVTAGSKPSVRWKRNSVYRNGSSGCQLTPLNRRIRSSALTSNEVFQDWASSIRQQANSKR